ncbi:MAG: MucR family transcriptional regulator [Desulfovibrio sp.]|nr:MucR family transcriptional regulator [Desulfovibrio sp.]
MAVSDDFLFKTIYDRLQDRPIEEVIREYEKAKIAMLKAEEVIQSRAVSQGAEKNDPVLAVPGQLPLPQVPCGENKAFTEVKYTSDDLKRNPQNAIGDNYIVCCLCGAEMRSLSKHLKAHHSISPEKYREICGYDKDIVLMSRNAASAAKERLTTARESRKSRKTAPEESIPEE